MQTSQSMAATMGDATVDASTMDDTIVDTSPIVASTTKGHYCRCRYYERHCRKAEIGTLDGIGDHGRSRTESGRIYERPRIKEGPKKG